MTRFFFFSRTVYKICNCIIKFKLYRIPVQYNYGLLTYTRELGYYNGHMCCSRLGGLHMRVHIVIR